MDFVKFMIMLVVMVADSDAGGHDEGHHDHVKLHVPEFIHHDHHTKVITIHHHHHKPKNEHHHHHHHHKPIIPHGPPPFHHTHHHTKTSARTVSKGHTSLGQKSASRPAHRKPARNHGHRGHGHKYHSTPVSFDPPTTNYAPPTINYASPSVNYGASPSQGNDYGSILPSVPNISTSPHVHGVVHTVKQVKVFDSLPGALPGAIGSNGVTSLKGYEVTEHGDEGEDDVFTSVNSLSQTYPGTYGFVRNAAAEQGSDDFSDISKLNTIQSHDNNPFTGAQPQATYSNFEDFTIQNYPPSAPASPSVQMSPFSAPSGFDDPANSVIGHDVSGNSLLSYADSVHEDTPVIFSREAGLQHAINTEGIETVSY